jgi:hypothetical protein
VRAVGDSSTHGTWAGAVKTATSNNYENTISNKYNYMKPYYYVQRTDGNKSTVKHNTVASAHKESLRLSEQHKGSAFEILMCVGITQTVKPTTFWIDGIYD